MLRGVAGGEWIAGKYEILGLIGRGGMATVWRARTHGSSGFTKTVAIKRVLPEYGSDDQFARMFVEEARVVSALQHPNIAQVHDFGSDQHGSHYIVMEWVDGLSLTHWVNAHRATNELTPWPYVAAIGIEVARALAAAHERVDERGRLSPVVHRDVSPSNVLVGRNGVVKLVDFGLAHARDRLWRTRPGTFKGKLAYTPPERLAGAPISASNDVYCLGIVLWESLAGKRLFRGDTDAEVLKNVRAGIARPLSDVRDDLPPALLATVHRALERDPADRFPDARALLRALAAILREQPDPTDAEPLGQSVQWALACTLPPHLAPSTIVDPEPEPEDTR